VVLINFVTSKIYLYIEDVTKYDSAIVFLGDSVYKSGSETLLSAAQI